MRRLNGGRHDDVKLLGMWRSAPVVGFYLRAMRWHRRVLNSHAGGHGTVRKRLLACAEGNTAIHFVEDSLDWASSPHLTPILFCSAFNCQRVRVLELEPVGRAAATIVAEAGEPGGLV